MNIENYFAYKKKKKKNGDFSIDFFKKVFIRDFFKHIIVFFVCFCFKKCSKKVNKWNFRKKEFFLTSWIYFTLSKQWYEQYEREIDTQLRVESRVRISQQKSKNKNN